MIITTIIINIMSAIVNASSLRRAGLVVITSLSYYNI